MRRSLLLLALLSLLLGTPGVARAGSVLGGSLNAPGERSHNVGGGWPEFFYVWEGLVRDKVSLGPRVGIQIWPLSVSVGLNMRFTLLEEGRVSLALLVVPSFNIAGFGGTRATYSNNYGFGRSRSFRPSLGPGVNLGLLATVDVSPVFHVNLSLENPLVIWIWTSPAEWWIEWPIGISGGVEYDVNFATSIFARVGAGPSIAFAGPNQLLGFHWHVVVGAQFRY